MNVFFHESSQGRYIPRCVARQPRARRMRSAREKGHGVRRRAWPVLKALCALQIHANMFFISFLISAGANRGHFALGMTSLRTKACRRRPRAGNHGGHQGWSLRQALPSGQLCSRYVGWNLGFRGLWTLMNRLFLALAKMRETRYFDTRKFNLCHVILFAQLNLVPVTTGPRVTTRRVPRCPTLFWMLCGMRPRPRTRSKASSCCTRSVVVPVPAWAPLRFPRSAKSSRTG